MDEGELTHWETEMRRLTWAFVAVAGAVACGGDKITDPPAGPVATVYSATGDIAAKVDEFRAILGASNGGTAGEQPSGRREINWDGAGAVPFNDQNNFPADFFNTNVKAGAVFTTAGTGFRNDDSRFTGINAAYAQQFTPFSPTVLFSPIGSNQLDQAFRVAGQPTPATVSGFGIVFSDVDLADSTTIQLFAKDGTSLGTYSAPARSDAAGLSFVGVTYPDPVIARVRITLGNGILAADATDISAGGTKDLVVLDNVVYGEPRKAF